MNCLLDVGQAADPVAQNDAYPTAVFAVQVQLGAFQRLAAGGHRELAEARHAPGVAAVHPVQSIEALHFAGDARGVASCIELGDVVDP